MNFQSRQEALVARDAADNYLRRTELPMRVDDLWHALANDDVTAAALRDGAALRLSLRAAVIREIEGFEFHHLSEDARTDFAAALSRLIWGDFTEFLICVRTWRVGPPGEEVVA